MKNKTLAKCYIKFFVEFIHHASKQDIIITAALLPVFWRRQNTSAQKPCNVFYAIHWLHLTAISHNPYENWKVHHMNCDKMISILKRHLIEITWSLRCLHFKPIRGWSSNIHLIAMVQAKLYLLQSKYLQCFKITFEYWYCAQNESCYVFS